ncbi:MAG: hypothetical protein ACLFTH_02950 [Candidatus Woesearchaeota archaeon]
MAKLKKLLTNTRVIILLIALLIAGFAISPQFSSGGVAIQSVEKGSPAQEAGVESPESGTTPTKLEVLKSINNNDVDSIEEYYSFIDQVPYNTTLLFKTDKDTYRVITEPLYNITELNQTELVNKTVERFDNETNRTVNVTVTEEVNKTEEEIIGTKSIGLNVIETPPNNIRKGLDLEGGTRVILEPEEAVSDDDLDLIKNNIRERLNVFGVSDVIVRSVKDIGGDTYIIVEIAGVSQEEVRELLSRQGKFEAKVGNETVFRGGDDIVYVCKSAECSGLDPNNRCQQDSEGEWFCNFRFSISLSEEAAGKQAEATKDLEVIYPSAGESGYLSKNLSLYLDDELVDQLRISADLKGKDSTEISITGSGSGPNQQAATENTLSEMKKLQTVLVTGSLPVKLSITQSNTISAILGDEFVDNALLIGALAILGVVAVITLRYRRTVVTVPAIIAMISEVILLLGFAALIGWRLDLAAIAGIIIAVGTGVDDQIIIIDETLTKKRSNRSKSWLQKLKSAFAIIMMAYFTTVVAMLPLWWSGAGLLKGFALTTIVGVTFGVFITRPAFASMLEILLGTDQKDKREE